MIKGGRSQGRADHLCPLECAVGDLWNLLFEEIYAIKRYSDRLWVFSLLVCVFKKEIWR